MIPIFTVLAAPLARYRRVPSVLWYTHKSLTSVLQLAHAWCDRVVTASPESFRIPSAKVVVTGHGVDTTLFAPAGGDPPAGRILVVGRVTPIKRHLLAVDALAALRARGIAARLVFVGEPVTAADQAYGHAVRERVEAAGLRDAVEWRGAVLHRMMPREYRSASFLLHLSETGSIDKCVLEAMSCGCPVVTSSSAFAPVLDRCPGYVAAATPDALADALERVLRQTSAERTSLGDDLRRIVVERHSLEQLTDALVELFRALRAGRGD